MKTLYLDCSMGAAGDMLTASLLELFPNKKEMTEKLNSIGLEGVEFIAEDSIKSGIKGTRSVVKIHGQEEEVEDVDIKHSHDHHHSHAHNQGHSHDHDEKHDHSCCHDHSHAHHHGHDHGHSHDHDEKHNHGCCHGHNHDHNHDDHCHHHHDHHHVHRGMKEIGQIVENLKLSTKLKEDIMAVYNLIAEAESISHDKPISEIHFHEVGAMDAIADITAVCFLIDQLGVDQIISSEINVGSGHVRCAHGILPVPAPATAYILKDVPIYSGIIASELCTPTGAALLKYFVKDYQKMPAMRIEKIGYGMGKKEFPVMNAVRSILGQTKDSTDIIYELSCNVDDMTGEEISFAMDRLFEAGAREVYIIPIIMKKSRPGNLIRVMTSEKEKDQIIETIFKHTSTIGLREVETKRYVLNREIEEKSSPLGKVRIKRSIGYGVKKEKLEYDDLSEIARLEGKSLEEVRKEFTRE